eukprot:1986652-Pyramimonas_sp.AAC.1
MSRAPASPSRSTARRTRNDTVPAPRSAAMRCPTICWTQTKPSRRSSSNQSMTALPAKWRRPRITPRAPRRARGGGQVRRRRHQ